MLKSDSNMNKKHFSFLDMRRVAALEIFLLLFAAGIVAMLVLLWADMPVAVKISSFVMLPVLSYSIILMPFNGIYFTRKNCYFVPAVWVRKAKLEDNKRISVAFKEMKAYRYCVQIKITKNNGKSFGWNYENEVVWNNQKMRRGRKMYMISYSKMNKIYNGLLRNSSCFIVLTIIDRDGNFTKQGKSR